ncbi:MAG: polysaccharide deacetylase family protein [Candidatus Competibacteraceae bacterium]
MDIDTDFLGRVPTAGMVRSREFMLTFDDGPLPGATERILSALATLQNSSGRPVKAGFFLVGGAPENFWWQRYYYAPYEIHAKGSIVNYPDLVRDISQAGHSIGNHTMHHPWVRWPWLRNSTVIREELLQWEAALQPILGAVSPRLFRASYSIYSASVRESVHRAGYRIIKGKAVGDTAPGMGGEQLKLAALRVLKMWRHPYPCVLIFHENSRATCNHLGAVVNYLQQQQGFRLVDFNPMRLPESEQTSHVKFETAR